MIKNKFRLSSSLSSGWLLLLVLTCFWIQQQHPSAAAAAWMMTTTTTKSTTFTTNNYRPFTSQDRSRIPSFPSSSSSLHFVPSVASASLASRMILRSSTSPQQQQQQQSSSSSSSTISSYLSSATATGSSLFLGSTVEEASKESPPSSFWELHPKSVRAVLTAMRDGHDLLEIEYPPLAASVMEQDDIGAYEVSRANFNLALEFAKSLQSTWGMVATTPATTSTDTTNSDQQQQTTSTSAVPPLEIAILVPDDAELQIILDKTIKSNVNMIVGDPRRPYPGIQIAALRTSGNEDDNNMNMQSNNNNSFKPEQFLRSMFGGAVGGQVRAIPNVNVYICITASAQELPDIETLHQLSGATIICFNLKLDILRGDLGAPAFPPKSFQDRFLSRIKPTYYLRTRQYSRSISRPPFIVSYQGCLFRTYPGEYQTLLDTGNGRYRRIVTNPVRPALGVFKEQLTQALREQGMIEEENSTLNFLRTGYKTTTWWEEDRIDASDSWKT